MFFEFVGISGSSVSISVIDRTSVVIKCTFAFRYTVYAPVLDRLHVCPSAYYIQTDTRVQYLDARSQCACTIDRTSITMECTSRLLHSCTFFAYAGSHLLALERISAICTSKPEAGKYIVFFFVFLLF